MLIIDAHNHPDWHGHNLDKSLENAAQYGIAATWLLSWECPADEYDPQYNPVSLTDPAVTRSPSSAALTTRSVRRATSCSATRRTRGGRTTIVWPQP